MTQSHDATTLAIFRHPSFILLDFVQVGDWRPSVRLHVLQIVTSQLDEVGPFLKSKIVGRNKMETPLLQLLGTVQLQQITEVFNYRTSA